MADMAFLSAEFGGVRLIPGPQGPQGPKGEDGSGSGRITDTSPTTLEGLLEGKDGYIAVQPVDSAPAAGSNNPVKSGGVYTALAGKYEKPGTGIPAADLAEGVRTELGKAHEHENKTVLDGVTAAKVSQWDGKQDALTFDLVPTQNSQNPVTSGGVYAAIQAGGGGGGGGSVIVDNVPTQGSPNAVSSGGVYTALQGKYEKPGTGIPASDMASAVQGELGKAHEHSNKSVLDGISASDVTSWNGKQSALTFDDAPTSGSSNPVKSGGIYTALAGKQDTLTFDDSPTASSANPVKSGGVYTALQGKQATLTFDNSPTDSSSNPVKSGGVYAAIEAAKVVLIPYDPPTVDPLGPAVKAVVDAAQENGQLVVLAKASEGDLPGEDSAEYFPLVKVWTEASSLGGEVWYAEFALAQEVSVTGGTAVKLRKYTATAGDEVPESFLTYSETVLQKGLTFDDSPTASSSNPVKSGGIYSAVAAVKTALLPVLQKLAGVLPELAYTAQANSGAATVEAVNTAIIALGGSVTHTVTQTLSHCSNSNTAASVTHGSGFSGTLTASTGYSLGTVTITMGGVDITSTAYSSGTGAISISSVTGAVVITATATAASYSVTKTLSHCSISNDASTVSYGASYSALFTAATGYSMSTVSVSMGGTDITASAYSAETGAISIASVTGALVITASASVISYSITRTLTNCTLSNDASTAAYGSSYSATLSVTGGYNLESIVITMGGTDITSSAWTSGTSTISIASVTGNIAITATAAARTLSSIAAVYDSSHTVYAGDSVDGLKTYLTVTATYSDTTTATVDSSAYTLSGDLSSTGSQTVTVSYGGKTTTFSVTVETRPVTLSSISAVLALNGHVVKAGDSLDGLKTYLTVTATYSDTSTSTVSSSNYTLSGSLSSAGSQTITVTYSGVTTTFSVTVYNAMTADRATLPAGYTQVEHVYSGSNQYVNLGVTGSSVNHAAYGVQARSGIANGTNWHVLSSVYNWYPYFRQGNSGARNFQGKYNKSGTTATSIDTSWEANTDYVVTAYPTVTINGTTAATLSDGGASDGTNLFVFARNESNTPQNPGNVRIYYIALYNSSNELTHYYVPCKNDSNVPGLYDTIGGSFYSSATGTALNAGEALV